MRTKLSGDEKAHAAIEEAFEVLADPVERFNCSFSWLNISQDEKTKWNSIEPRALQELTGLETLAVYEQVTNTALAESSRDHFNRGIILLLQAEEAQFPKDCMPHLRDALVHISNAIPHEHAGSESANDFQSMAMMIDDRRLTTTLVNSVLNNLEQSYLALVALCSSDAIALRDIQSAKEAVTLIREAPGFSQRSVDTALSLIYVDHTKAIESKLETFEQELESLSDSPAEEMQVLISEIQEAVDPEVDILLEIGDLPGLAEEHTRDRYASMLRDAAISLANKHSRFDLSQVLAERAKVVVCSQAMSRKLASDLEILDRNKDYATCAFCKTNPTTAEAILFVDMHIVLPLFDGAGAIVVVSRTDRSHGSVLYKAVQVPIPRCTTCKSLHDNIDQVGCILAWIVALIVGIVVGVNEGWVGLIVGVIALIGAGVVAMIMNGIINVIHPHGLSRRKKHPAVKKMKSDGYSFGAKPSGTR